MKVRWFSGFRLRALILAVGLPAWLGIAALARSQTSQGSGHSQPPPAQQPPAQQPPAQQPPAAAPVELPKPSPEEEAAYKAFFNLKTADGDQIIAQGEEFVKKYPASVYLGAVYSRLTTAYLTKQDIDKFYVVGQRALALNPDNVDVLSMMGWVLPHNYNSNELDADQKLVRAEQYCKHAIELLNALQKPAGLTDEAFAVSKSAELSRSHSGLGLVNYRRGHYAEAAEEMQLATKLSPAPDPVDYFVLGVALQHLTKFSDAAAAYDKCAQISGQMQPRCKQNMEQAKKQAAAVPPEPAKP